MKLVVENRVTHVFCPGHLQESPEGLNRDPPWPGQEMAWHLDQSMALFAS